jgi:hypothetical protein
MPIASHPAARAPVAAARTTPEPRPPPSLPLAQVIDAGQFDMQTTNDERKQNLEALLADEERAKLATNLVRGGAGRGGNATQHAR